VLVIQSIRDFLLSQSAPQTRLPIQPGIASIMSGKVEEPLSLTTDHADEHGSTNGVSNGTTGASGTTTNVSRFDPAFTDKVINATGPNANPRLRKVMASLTRHLHDFCRENEITIDEYMAGIDMVRERES